jgi:N-acetylglucosaminyldiphosphoundecaprenol N-acetyl-beta-D-mannosaminyltransferase
VVWLAWRRGYRQVDRVYAPDLMLAAFEHSVARGWRHFFYGGNSGIAELLAQKMGERFPGLRIAGTYCPPFRPLTPAEDAQVIERINSSRADIVWVGIGAPKQDRWMAGHLGKIDAPVMIGVGAGFDFLAGVKPWAPRWIQRSGLEWLFRMCCEPRRLAPRYLVNNPVFIGLLLRDLVRNRAFAK